MPLTHQPPQGFLILFRSLGKNIRWQCGSGCFFVPILGFQPVAHELLVVAGRIFSRRIMVGWPETGRIGSERLIYEIKPACVILTEFELGVRDNNALCIA